ncbi:MAG: GIY-YIG nuclease family protein [Bacteroidia bacterium]
MLLKHHEYFVYITTNQNRTTLYVGVTNNLSQRITEHFLNQGKQNPFTGKYNCYHLVYFERFKYIDDAIAFEKKLKGWKRDKKEALIRERNPDWNFLNEEVADIWPPDSNSQARSSRV